MISIKDYAKEHGVSYEAVRKQIERYYERLEDHIIVQNKTRYLDEDAVQILDELRKSNPVIVMQMDKDEEILRLHNQVDQLLLKVATLQETIISRDERIGLLQDKQIALLEDTQSKAEDIRTAAEQKISEADSRVREAESRAMAAEQRSATLEAELNALKLAAEQKPKGFFARLFGI